MLVERINYKMGKIQTVGISKWNAERQGDNSEIFQSNADIHMSEFGF